MVTLIHNSSSSIQVEMKYLKTIVKISNDLEKTVVYLSPTVKYFIVLDDFNANHVYWSCGNPNQRGNMIYKWVLENNLILLIRGEKATYQSSGMGFLISINLILVSHEFHSFIKD